ncbi:MAG: BolA family transcriptional regulator [Pseudomonadaceae bacterium]|nr:BolA family transcriptional regulator [Pseudomonadaceae bacterium]
MSELSQALATAIQTALPGATVQVDDPDGAHLSAVVEYAGFAGKPMLAQHRMVYAALGDAFETTLHALQLTTKVPR